MHAPNFHPRLKPLLSSLLILSVYLLPVNATAQEPQSDLQARVESGLSQLNHIKGKPTWSIKERMKHYGVPGMSLAVIQNNKVAWSKSYGVKDLNTMEPVTDSTLFQCASISKPLSSFAALRLVQAGAFDLDTDINTYLESWSLPDNQFTQDKKVTLRLLVSHRGGLSGHGFQGYSPDQPVPTLLQILDGQSPANSEPVRVMATPGSRFQYSGGGYCILQQMIIDHTQRDFAETMDTLVLDPLGMKKSTYQQPLPPETLSHAATGYLPNGQEVAGKRHTYPEMAPAGLWSTADELAQFLIEMQLAYNGVGERLLSEALAKQMIDQQLGIFRRQSGSDNYFGHGGWNEGFCSDSRAHRDKGYGVVVLTNANQPSFIEEVVNSVARAYQWEGIAPVYEPLEIDQNTISEFTGRYNMNGQLVRIVTQDNKLLMDQPGIGRKELFRIGPHKFISQTAPEVIGFSKNKETGRSQFAYLQPDKDLADQEITATLLTADEKLPIEWLESGNYEKALAGYRSALNSNPSQPNLQESAINELGYGFLNNGQTEIALRVFRVNTELYPDAFNTWDSLAECYLNLGDQENAKLNYEKSLELNPNNLGAKEALKKLKQRP